MSQQNLFRELSFMIRKKTVFCLCMLECANADPEFMKNVITGMTLWSTVISFNKDTAISDEYTGVSTVKESTHKSQNYVKIVLTVLFVHQGI